MIEKIKHLFRRIVSFLFGFPKKLFNRFFWKRNFRGFLFVACGLVIAALFLVLLIDDQSDAGAQEAGEQLSELADNIRKHYQLRPDFWALSTADVAAKNLYPESVRAEGNSLLGYFGTPLTIGADAFGTPVMPTGRQFAIAYHDLTKAQCVGLGAHGFTQKFWLGLKRIDLIAQTETYSFDWGRKDFDLPIDKFRLKNLCRPQENTLVFYFE